MKIKYMLILAAAMMLVSSVCAQNDITIKVTAEKTDFLLGEPVIVYVTFTNNGEKPVKAAPMLGPEEDFCKYLITDPDEKTRTFSPVYLIDREDWPTLNRGESVRGGARIFYGGDGYYFKKPGDYSVVVEYQGTRSNLLKLKVLEPLNNDQRAQAGLILDHPEVGLFLMLEGSDELEDARKQMNIMIREYPNSLLTDYIRVAEAHNQSVPARNFITKKPRKADFPAAIRILDRLKDKDLPLFYQHRAYGDLSRCYLETGKPDEAKTVLENFRRKLELNREFMPFHIQSVEEQIRKIR